MSPPDVFGLLRKERFSFFLDSGMDPEKLGRYSFIGWNPFLVLSSRDREITVTEGTRKRRLNDNPFDVLNHFLELYRLDHCSLPVPFSGGAVGYLGYDVVRFFERLPETAQDELAMPALHMLVTDTLVIFDHVRHRLLLCANAHVPDGCDPDAVYDDALARLDEIEAQMHAPLPTLPAAPGASNEELTSNQPREEYENAVRAAKDNTSLEVICSFTFDTPTPDGYRTMMGVSPAQMAEAALDAGADILGTNCSLATGEMVPVVAALRAAAPDVPILVHPNAGRPIQQDDGTVAYPETPEAMAAVGAMTKRVADAIRAEFAPAGLSVYQANGTAAGQTVFHYHTHLMGRAEGSQLSLHARQQGDAAVLAEQAARLAARIGG